MGDNDGFAMEEIRERHSNSFSSHKSSPDLKRAPTENNTWPDSGEKSTSASIINMSGSTMVKRETSVVSNSQEVVYTWSGLTIKTKQERRSIKDTILRREPPRPKTILRDGK